MVEFESVSQRTEKFNNDVIESTIEHLAWASNENGLSEDLLDRLKATWIKNLRDTQRKNHEEA